MKPLGFTVIWNLLLERKISNFLSSVTSVTIYLGKKSLLCRDFFCPLSRFVGLADGWRGVVEELEKALESGKSNIQTGEFEYDGKIRDS